MDKTAVVNFANGMFAVAPKDLPRDVVAERKETHADWKTALYRDFPIMRPGMNVRVLDIWANFYGLWARVEIDGHRIDVPPTSLRWSQANE